MIRAYKLIVEEKLKKEIMKGIPKDVVKKIKTDIQKFKNSYVTA
jgi:hypothetical protein